MKRIVVGLASILLVVVATPAVAQAAYPTTAPSLTGPSSVLAVGGTENLTMTNCAPNVPVTATLNPGGQTVGHGQADAGGTAIFPITVPAGTTPGSFTVTATCGGVSASMALTVVAKLTAAPPSGQAFTGFDAELVVLGALALFGVGSVALMLGRRRRDVV